MRVTPRNEKNISFSTDFTIDWICKRCCKYENVIEDFIKEAKDKMIDDPWIKEYINKLEEIMKDEEELIKQ